MYKYSFNGQEKDDEVKGAGNSIDFGARIYDPRLGNFLSLDPLSKKYPYVSNYSYALDNPVFFIDNQGEDVHPSLAMRLFHPKQYRAVITAIKTDEGKKLFQDYASKREAKKYWGSDQAGKNSKNTEIVFRSAEEGESAVTVPSIKVDNNYTNVREINGDNVDKVHGDSKVKIDVFVFGKNSYAKGTIGGIIENVAHEGFAHAKYILMAINTLRNDKLTLAEKQTFLEDAKKDWGILDPDLGHAMISMDASSSYESVLKEIKQKFPKYAKDIDAAMKVDKERHYYAEKVLKDDVKDGDLDKSKIEEPK